MGIKVYTQITDILEWHASEFGFYLIGNGKLFKGCSRYSEGRGGRMAVQG
jgi:hypothetical protein